MMSAAPDDIRQPPADAAIFDRIVAAVLEQKLSGGAKLPEAALCEAFECSRTQIRRVLVVLAERGVVTLHPNRGAFVAKPSADEARDVFEARRAIERSIVLSAADRIEPDALSELRANARAGAEAEARGERSELIRLSGQFHLRLAEVAGNAVLARFLEDLVTRTSLTIGLYGSHSARTCSEFRTRRLGRRARPTRRARGGRRHGASPQAHRERARHSRCRGSAGRRPPPVRIAMNCGAAGQPLLLDLAPSSRSAVTCGERRFLSSLIVSGISFAQLTA